MKSILIACIGNDLVGDDGLGTAVYSALQSRALPEGVRLVNLGLGGLDLLEIMQGEELLLVVDGLQLGGPVGEVHCLAPESLEPAPGRPVSGHGIGLQEALKMGETLYPERMVKKALLLGIEGYCFDQLGQGLSPEVAGALPELLELITSIIDQS